MEKSDGRAYLRKEPKDRIGETEIRTVKLWRGKTMINKIWKSMKKDAVLSLAAVAAVLSSIVIPPDSAYLGYIDYDTISMLFCLMLIMEGLKGLGFFQFTGEKILKKVKTERGIVFSLVFLCFFTSMFITNDVALITFVPFGLMVLEMAGMRKATCFTVVFMTIAANLGSMAMPMGNPQNLYLYSISHMTIGTFLYLMLPYAIISAVLLAVFLAVRYKKRPAAAQIEKSESVPFGQTFYFFLLFFLCLLSVAGLIQKGILLILVVCAVGLKNRNIFLKVDYGLLVTFLCFFIFVGNINRLDGLRELLFRMIDGRERIISVAFSQVISNVPAAILLSGCTENWKELLIGTNIGGLGTLIASMASLISYKKIALQYPQRKREYFILFTVWNVVFLLILYVCSCFLAK